MYTKERFKTEINKYLTKNGYDLVLIAKLSYEIYMKHIREIDKELRNDLLNIANMGNGSEFEMTEAAFLDFLKKM